MTCTISCPGKVLLTGGYLVLDPQYSGLVVAVDSRFYATISNQVCIPSDTHTIHVESPQFINGKWTFELQKEPFLLVPFNSNRNLYVETTLYYSLLFISGINPRFMDKFQSLNIVIQGDNPFYSQNKENPGKFEPLGCELSQVHKTGLGSSAAMITSLVGCLLVFFEICDLNSENSEIGKRWIHHLSQFCHCLAQGKIGSGFDVSCAVYGSHVYQRFSPEIIKDELSNSSTLTAQQLVSLITKTQWDNLVQPFQLPMGLHLVLGDVDSGSNTPKLVSSVLKWKNENQLEANQLFTVLNKLNHAFLDALKELHNCQEMSLYSSAMDGFSQMQIQLKMHSSIDLGLNSSNVEQHVIYNHIVQIHSLFQQIRACLRELSSKAQVPIEPLEQTELLDSCLTVPGVVVAGVPGAGGLDAIFCLAIGNKSQKSLVEYWKDKSNRVTLLPTTNSSSQGGIRLEKSIY